MPRRRLTKRTRSTCIIVLSALGIAGAGVTALRTTDAVDERRLAEERMQDQDYFGALRALDRALEMLEGADRSQQQSELAALHARRGTCNLMLGRPRSAREDLREARILQPDSPARWSDEGRALLDLEFYREAAQHFEQAAQQFPDDAQFWNYAAGCAWFEQSQVEQDTALEVVLARAPASAAAEVERAVDAYVASRSTRPQFLRELPFLATPSQQPLVEALTGARGRFARSEQLLAGYEDQPNIEPRAGLTAAELLFRSGRFYDARLLLETLAEIENAREQSSEYANSLRLMLANDLYTRGLYEDAAQVFLDEWRNLLQARQFSEAREVKWHVVECYLRARDGERALDHMDEDVVAESEQALPLFYLGMARHHAGRSANAVRPIEQLVELWQARNFLPLARWRRGTEHRAWVIESLVEVLRSHERFEMLDLVLNAASDLDPGELRWKRERAEIWPHLRRRPQGLATLRREALRLPGSSTDDLVAWVEAERAAWRGRRAIEDEVEWKCRRILLRYAEQNRGSAAVGSGIVSNLLAARDRRTRKEASEALASLRDSGTVLLAELDHDAFLAYEVYHALLRDGDRDQAYLVLLGLRAEEPDVLHFERLLAEHEYSDGNHARAAEHFAALAAANPTDARSAWFCWSLLHELGDQEALRAFESDLLDYAPHHNGRVPLALASLVGGDLRAAEAIGTALSVDEPCGPTLQAIAALARVRDGRTLAGRDLALEVIGHEPRNPLALVALLESSPRSSDRTNPLGSERTTLQQLPAADLALLGRTFADQGGHARAQTILGLALEREPHHQPARRQRVDSLLSLGRVAEATSELDLLSAAEPSQDTLRRALCVLLQQGPRDCLDFIQALSGAERDAPGVKRWSLLLAARLGFLETVRRELRDFDELNEEDLRFLALQWVLRSSDRPADESLPPPLRRSVLSLYRSASESEVEQDRELERWVSIELAGQRSYSLSETLLEVLLLRGESQWESLERSKESQLLNRNPSLGERARVQVERFFREGRTAVALSVLLRYLEAVPEDEGAIQLLARWSNRLGEEELLRAREVATQTGSAAEGALFEGLWRIVDGRPDEARSELERAWRELEDPTPAIHALLDLEQSEFLRQQIDELDGSPLQRLARGHRNRALRDSYEKALQLALERMPAEVSLLKRIHAYASQRGTAHAIPRKLQRALRDGLLHHPLPEWDLFELLGEWAAYDGAAADELLPLAVGIRSAATSADVPLQPQALRRAVVPLASALCEQGELAGAEALIDLAASSSPYSPELLHVRASVERARGEQTEADRLLELATICGLADAEVATRLAQRAFDQFGDVDEAARWCQLALDAVDIETPNRVRASAWELQARILFVQGQTAESFRAWQRVAEAQGLDVNRLPLHARQFFVAQRPSRARVVLATALEHAEEADRALLRRLLELLPEPRS